MSANKTLDFGFYQQEDQPLFSILTKDIRVMRYITEKAESDLEANDNFKRFYSTTQHIKIKQAITNFLIRTRILVLASYLGMRKGNSKLGI